MKTKLLLSLIILVLTVTACASPAGPTTAAPSLPGELEATQGAIVSPTAAPGASFTPETASPEMETPTQPAEPTPIATQPAPKVTVAAALLDVPWEIVPLPDGSLLVTERPGRLVHLVEPGIVLDVPGVVETSEGGLLGLAIDPDFDENGWLYLYLTANENGGLVNRVERYTFNGQALSERQVLLVGIRGAAVHDGGRLAFGPDGYLYITTGDAGDAASAQDLASLNGKILRIAANGSIPPDNPFGTAVWSYGHRNPQGLAWDAQGRLWAVEHGPSGLGSGYDELNLIVPGGNYGWPVIQGDETAEGMLSPVLQSGGNETWAPADLAFLNGRLFFAGLRGQTLYVVEVLEQSVGPLELYLAGEYGRLRSLSVSTGGLLYLGTSNRDGRGVPAGTDDQILLINTDLLGEKGQP